MPLVSADEPSVTSNGFSVPSDLTHTAPYWLANAWPVACWKKDMPTAMAVRLRLTPWKSSRVRPCSGSSARDCWILANSRAMAASGMVPARRAWWAVLASSVRSRMRSQRGDWGGVSCVEFGGGGEGGRRTSGMNQIRQITIAGMT